MVVFLIERLLFYISQGQVRGKITKQLSSLILSSEWTEAEQLLRKKSGLLPQGCALLIYHREQNKQLREEIMTQWLSEQRRHLFAHLKWLTLIAVISPMLGLLGTVLGIIESFQAIAHHSGPISPALLADGLWQAMHTTAAGLSVAMPALVAVHSFRIWGSARLEYLAGVLNQLNLSLEGIDLLVDTYDPIPALAKASISNSAGHPA